MIHCADSQETKQENGTGMDYDMQSIVSRTCRVYNVEESRPHLILRVLEVTKAEVAREILCYLQWKCAPWHRVPCCLSLT